MAYEENARPAMAHNIILEGRAKLSVSGVEDVDSFDEAEIVMRTVQGNLTVRGTELHVEKLSLDIGELTVTGTVSQLDYAEVAPSSSLWTRLFK